MLKCTDANKIGVNGWLIGFGLSVAGYFSAMWLHARPEFVVSMFRMLE